MRDLTSPDPYFGNILLDALGPVRSRKWAMKRLDLGPSFPTDLLQQSRDVRLRRILGLRDIHICREVDVRVYETIDTMLRDRYRLLNPSDPRTMLQLSGEEPVFAQRRMPPTAAYASGISGSGKSVTLERCLHLFPRVQPHKNVPGIVGNHFQAVWQSIDVPASGRTEDLARMLMLSWKLTTGDERFDDLLALSKIARPMAVLNEWAQVANSHFLGLLHLDEIQNLFKIGTLEQRKKRKDGDRPPELRVVQDECLKWILLLMNMGVPIFFSGTPDGMGALSTRLSTMQRVFGLGVHTTAPYSSFDFDALCDVLEKNQLLRTPLKMDSNVKRVITDLTARVPRVVMALWIGATRIALESEEDTLRIEHIVKAEEVFFAPLRPAIKALQSGRPELTDKYEDLVTSDPEFWPNLWRKLEP
jgi:AAA domain